MSITQVSYFNPDGLSYGTGPTDKISFYNPGNACSIPQRSTPFQQNTWGLPMGQVISFASNIGAAVTVVKGTTTVGSLPCPSVANNTGSAAGGDFVLNVSKAVAVANMGICAFRANAAATVEVVFCNPSAANATAAANETYITTIIRNAPVISATVSTGAVLANTTVEQFINLAPSTTATGNVTFNSTSGVLTGVTMVNNGGGYVIPPTVVFSAPYPVQYTPQGQTTPWFVADNPVAPSGITATGIATINAAGQVTGVILTNNGGAGYFSTTFPPTVTFIGGNVIMPGMCLAVNKTSANTANLAIVNARVSGPNQVAVQFAAIGANVAANANDTYQFMPFMTMPAASPIIQFQANAANLTVTTANVANTTAVATPGILSTDIVMCSGPIAANTGGVFTFPPPTANNLELYYVGGGNTTWTPANGVYNWNLFKPAPQPPVQTWQVPLTFSNAITANSCTEIMVTLPTGVDLYSGQANLAANTVSLVVNKPSWTANLGILGARANSNTTIGITFINTSGANITPPNETYTIASIPVPLPTLGANVLAGQAMQTVSAGFNQLMYLTNEMQQTLQTLGLIRGA